MRILSVIFHRRNIRAEALINTMGEVVPYAYGPHDRQSYGMIIIGKIGSDYRKELIMVTWKEEHWKNTEEHISWSKLCLTSDRKNRACKKRKRMHMAYMIK